MSTSLWTASYRRLLEQTGTGGASWTRTRRTGATPSSDASSSTATIAGYVCRATADHMTFLRAGAAIADGAWVFVGAAGVDIRSHDELESDDDGQRFTVIGTPTTDQGICGVEVQPR